MQWIVLSRLRLSACSSWSLPPAIRSTLLRHSHALYAYRSPCRCSTLQFCTWSWYNIFIHLRELRCWCCRSISTLKPDKASILPLLLFLTSYLVCVLHHLMGLMLKWNSQLGWTQHLQAIFLSIYRAMHRLLGLEVGGLPIKEPDCIIMSCQIPLT